MNTEYYQVLRHKSAFELAEMIREEPGWDYDLVHALCREAGMSEEEWEGYEDLEEPAEKAAEILGVGIY